VKYLLDTHAILWMFQGNRRLGKIARKTIQNEANRLYFSIAGYWEICIKHSLGKLDLSDEWASVFEEELTRNRIEWLPVSPKHARGIVDLAFFHNDPFDRLMISQAVSEGMTIITMDKNVRKYNVQTLW